MNQIQNETEITNQNKESENKTKKQIDNQKVARKKYMNTEKGKNTRKGHDAIYKDKNRELINAKAREKRLEKKKEKARNNSVDNINV